MQVSLPSTFSMSRGEPFIMTLINWPWGFTIICPPVGRLIWKHYSQYSFHTLLSHNSIQCLTSVLPVIWTCCCLPRISCPCCAGTLRSQGSALHSGTTSLSGGGASCLSVWFCRRHPEQWHHLLTSPPRRSYRKLSCYRICRMYGPEERVFIWTSILDQNT